MLHQYISSSKVRNSILLLYLFICIILLFVTLGSLYDINPDNITNDSIRTKIWSARRAADGLGVMIGIAAAVVIALQIL